MATFNFEITLCNFSDLSTCVEIFYEAFATDPNILNLYPRCDQKALKEKSLKGYEKSYATLEARFYKAVCIETGQIAAFSKWVHPHRPDPAAEDPEIAIRNDSQISGSNNELVIEFMTKMLRGRKKWITPETDYFMSILAVRPKYQRQGVGSKLLARGLELADRNNSKTFIQASPTGLSLYLRHGWEEVDEIVLDFSSYGGPKEVKTALLIREPKSVEIV
ncbi:hypothetical protein PVAG01_08030 [Phlyctema vagabunda]|uniref:N-acetyltransferase domain-containing protein n=1 Tax=Phlyctema vagabunda TaxID=108571 RepID=A0ABR4PE31_9HELO